MEDVGKWKPFTPAWRPGWLGWAGDARFQGEDSTGKIGELWLSIIEFDDQGRCHSRYQLKHLMDCLESLKDRDPVILCFAHGWKHNGSSGDDNLGHFLELLRFTAKQVGQRPVIGVFLAWRGLSFYSRIDAATSLFTFLSRKAAAMRVAMGAPREVLERLRKFKEDAKDKATFIIIGHSFGGLIVFNALAQSLVRSAIAPGDKSKVFANLVILVNPAFEGVRYLPLHDIVREAYDTLDTAHGAIQQPQDDNSVPAFVAVTSEADWATRYAFPLGMGLTWLREHPRQQKERQALTHTVGHVEFMRTHSLALKNAAGQPTAHAQSVRTRFSENNPFWMMYASKDIIRDHNDIWNPAFVDWAKGILIRHINGARSAI
jgi:pimeloyl-ACP methyl ester carboxylesterase